MLNCPFLKPFIPLGLALGLLANGAYASDTWPEIQLPDYVDSFEVGNDISVNGLPIHARGFVTSRPRGEVMAWFRQKMGKHRVENTLGDQLILGRAQDHYFLTVQISSTKGGGTRGIATVADIKAASENMDRTKSRTEHWLANMPLDSRILTQVQSEDQGRRSLYLVLTNPQEIQLNASRVKQILQADGYRLEREMTSAPPEMLPVGDSGSISGKTLYFNGEGKQAMSVIYQKNGGQTVVVMNLITKLSGY